MNDILKNRTFWLILLLVAFIVILMVAIRKHNIRNEQVAHDEKITKAALKDKITEKEQELSLYNRKLWGDNAYWMRNYIVSYINGSKDIPESAQRLLKNQEQIGRGMGMWYGKEVEKKIITMLHKNMVAFGDMLAAMLNKKKNEAIMSEKRWDDNTESIVSYLSTINPKLDKSEMTKKMKKYNEMMTTQAISRFKGKHSAEIGTFDKAYDYAIFDLADTITKGIVEQFPDKFDINKPSSDANELKDSKDVKEVNI